MMREQDFTRNHETCLRDQAISDSEPGPVRQDFQMLLDFVGPQGVEAGGKYNLLALKFIGELDSRLSRPLNLSLKRPQLRSHPYLQGLHLLLRASGLAIVEGVGAKAKLVVDFKYDGGGMGKGGAITMTANGKTIAEGRLERTIPIQFSLGEGLDIGIG